MSPDDLMTAAKKAGLDGICITEHNRIWKAEDAKALSDKHGLAVFRGVEVTTTGGDIIVIGMEEEPDGMLTPPELKQKVDAANAVAIAAHPFRGFLLFGFGALSMDLESAMETLIYGYEKFGSGSNWFPWYIRFSYFKPLHNDPRFWELVKKMKLAPYFSRDNLPYIAK